MDDATSHAGCMRPRILMLSKKSRGETHTSLKHRSMAGHTPMSTSPTQFIRPRIPDLISSFHFHIFLSQNLHTEADSSIDQAEKLEGFDS